MEIDFEYLKFVRQKCYGYFFRYTTNKRVYYPLKLFPLSIIICMFYMTTQHYEAMDENFLVFFWFHIFFKILLLLMQINPTIIKPDQSHDLIPVLALILAQVGVKYIYIKILIYIIKSL